MALADLLDPARLTTVEREREGQRVVVPALRMDGFDIWGATAMVLAELLALVRPD